MSAPDLGGLLGFGDNIVGRFLAVGFDDVSHGANGCGRTAESRRARGTLLPLHLEHAHVLQVGQLLGDGDSVGRLSLVAGGDQAQTVC